MGKVTEYIERKARWLALAFGILFTFYIARGDNAENDPPGGNVIVATCQALARAFPTPDPAELNKPRGDRKTVELIGWKARYEPDIAALVAHQGPSAIRPGGGRCQRDGE